MSKFLNPKLATLYVYRLLLAKTIQSAKIVKALQPVEDHVPS